MKKTILRILITAILMSTVSGSVEGRDHQSPGGAAKMVQDDGIVFGNHALININNMSMWFKRDGYSAGNPYTDNSGVTYPRSTEQVIYRDGLVWGGKVMDGDPQVLRVGGSTYSQGTVPGRIIVKGVAADRDDPTTRIYRVRRDYRTADLRMETAEYLDVDLSEVTDDEIAQLRAQYDKDWREWPAAWGAPFYDRDGDGTYTPRFDAAGDPVLDGTADEPGVANADQVAWLVLNDLDLGATTQLYGAKPIGIEEQILMWAYARTDALGEAIFKKYTVIYKGTADTPDTARIEDMHFAQWVDPDLGDYGDDFVGSDVELSLGYVYNADDSDSHYDPYDLAPPAAGYDFLQGPIVPVYTRDDDGNQILDESSVAISNFERRPGYRNLPMTAFVYFASGSSIDDPELNEYNGTKEWYNLLRGYEPQPDVDNPQPYLDPHTGEETKFTMSGDPTLATGWNDGVPLPSGDRRMVMATGPFELALNDTQEVVVALLGGSGSDWLRSVSQLKFNDLFVQQAYDNLFEVPRPPQAPKVRGAELDGAIVLDWGWDGAAVGLTEGQDESGFVFEGYNLYQLPSAEARLDQAARLATYDLVNGVTTILGRELDDESGVILDLPRQLGRDTGLRRNDKITWDALGDQPLINGREYYFAVTAYNRNRSGGSVMSTLESELRVMAVVPEAPPPGTRYVMEAEQVLQASHVAGGSDGSVQFMMVDPTRATGNDYRVAFDQNAEGETTWSLTNTTTGTVMLADQSDQSGAGQYVGAEGFEVRVAGPPNGMKDWDAVDRFWTWGAAGVWGAEGFNGAITGDPNNYWFEATTLSPADLKTVEIRFTAVHEEEGENQYKPLDVNNEDVSMAYRYLRGAGGDIPAPGDLTTTAVPYDFTPYVINTEGDGFVFQDRVPIALSAWDVESDPPRRLEVGFVENLQPGGLVNGAYGPAWYSTVSNIDSGGPREWLFVFGLDYTDPAGGQNSDILLNSGLYTEPLPHMWIIFAERRQETLFPQEDATFTLVANHVNTPDDEFTFTVLGLIQAPMADAGGDQTALVGESAALDGSASSDEGGAPLSYLWTPSPENPAEVELADASNAQTTFTPLEAGTYTFSLVVNNGTVDSDPQTVRVTAVEAALTGDVNGDGSVDTRDAFLTLRMANRLSLYTNPAGHTAPTSYEQAAADVNGDGEVTVADALLIMYMALDRIAKPVRPELVAAEARVRWGEASPEGEVLTVPLVVEGRTDLHAADVRIRYRPEALALIGVDADAANTLTAVDAEGDGLIQASLVNADGIVGEAGGILNIRFRVETAPQEGNITLDQAYLYDANATQVAVQELGRTAELRIVPTTYALSQSFPNPFNPSTEIRYQLPESGPVELVVYDLLGQVVVVLVDEAAEAGVHSITWSGVDHMDRPVGSGTYLVRMKAGRFVQVRKVTLAR